MSDVSLGGAKKEVTTESQKMIYLNIPSAIMLIIDLADSQNIKKYSEPIIQNIKQALSNKELRKILCEMFGMKTAKKFRDKKPVEFKFVTDMFGDIWGLNEEESNTKDNA